MRTAEDVAGFTLNYYRSTERHRLGEALRCASSIYGGRVSAPEPGQDLIHGSLTLYFFARVAQLDSNAAAAYQQLLSESGPEQIPLGARRYVEAALWLASAERRGSPPETLPAHFPVGLDILSRPATSLADLDYLWTEFCATGSPEPVRKVVDVLRWPDTIRAKLSSWLATPAAGRWDRWRRRRMVRRLEQATGILCDADTGSIQTPGDLDCLSVGGRSGERDRAEFPVVRAALPFPLAEEDVAYIITKGAARWSFLSLVASHPVVRQVWEAEMRGDAAALETALSRRRVPDHAHALPDRDPSSGAPSISIRKHHSGTYDELLISEIGHAVHINLERGCCFVYGVPGTWAFAGEQGALRSQDGLSYIGVSLHPPDDFQAFDGPDSIARALEGTTRYYDTTISSRVSVEVAPFPTPRFRAARLRASWTDPSGDQLQTERVFVDIGQGWVARITAPAPDSDALVRGVIETLGTTSERRFHAAFFQDRYPGSADPTVPAIDATPKARGGPSRRSWARLLKRCGIGVGVAGVAALVSALILHRDIGQLSPGAAALAHERAEYDLAESRLNAALASPERAGP